MNRGQLTFTEQQALPHRPAEGDQSDSAAQAA
jgi:hypothetical protein